MKYCNLRVLFSKVIYDNKVTLNTSIKKLKSVAHVKEFIIYENNSEFFVGAKVLEIDSIRTYSFDVTGYLICA